MSDAPSTKPFEHTNRSQPRTATKRVLPSTEFSGGEAGSIGVYTVHLDISEALAKAGIKPTIIKAGKHKTEGDPAVPLTEEVRKAIQARADAAYELFVGDVAAARGTTPAAVRNGYGQGAVLAAKAAKAEGLVDRIATFEEIVQRLVGRPAAVAAGRARLGAGAIGQAFVATADSEIDRRLAELEGIDDVARRRADLRRLDAAEVSEVDRRRAQLDGVEDLRLRRAALAGASQF